MFPYGFTKSKAWKGFDGWRQPNTVTITPRSGGASDHKKVIASCFLIQALGLYLIGSKPA
jgi:hypothetical protein